MAAAAAVEQERRRLNGLARGRGAGGAAEAVPAPSTAAPRLREAGAPRLRPGRLLVLRVRPRSTGSRLSASSLPHGLRERGLRGGVHAGLSAPDRPSRSPPQRAARLACGGARAVRTPLALRALHVHHGPAATRAGDARGRRGQRGGPRGGPWGWPPHTHARVRAVPGPPPLASTRQGWAS